MDQCPRSLVCDQASFLLKYFDSFWLRALSINVTVIILILFYNADELDKENTSSENVTLVYLSHQKYWREIMNVIVKGIQLEA